MACRRGSLVIYDFEIKRSPSSFPALRYVVRTRKLLCAVHYKLIHPYPLFTHNKCTTANCGVEYSRYISYSAAV